MTEHQTLPPDFDPEAHEVDPNDPASVLQTLSGGAIVYAARSVDSPVRHAVAKVDVDDRGERTLRCWHCYPDGSGGQICILIECPFTLPEHLPG